MMNLTNREIEILKLLCFSNCEIALKCNVSANTVRSYITNIFNKLGTDNRQTAQIKAVKLGIITLDDIQVEGF